MPHQLFSGGLKARNIYPELSKCFYKENANVTWEEFLTTKFGLWIDTRSSTNNALRGSVMTTSFDVSFVDPSFVDCIVLDKDITHYSTSKFHDIHGIQGRLWWFYICRL